MGAAPFVFQGCGGFGQAQPLRRYYGDGDLHFVTFSCYRRRPYLGTRRARDRFVKVLEQVRARWDSAARLCGHAGHVHLLKGDPSKVLQVLKQKTSRILKGGRRNPGNKQLSLPYANAKEGTAHFWQRRFYDFNLWSAKKLREKLEYMHANPVKRKLVAHPKN